MKKLLAIILASAFLCSPLYAADQWDTSDPAGTESASDIDTLVVANNESLDRLVVRYKRGLGVNFATTATLSALAGEIAIPDSSDSTVRWRRNTTATSVGWSDLDTGTEAVSTTYYVYATADTDVTTCSFKISASSTAPTGITYYRKIAQFYNNASGDIEQVKSLRNEDGTDYRDLVKAWVNFSDSGTATINSSYGVSSITDNGTGDYTITWSTAFSSANYVIFGGAFKSTLNMQLKGHITSGLSTSSARIYVTDGGGTATDPTYAWVAAIGDQT